jgi:hypothetical protein
VRGEHGNYFDALEKHPRLLVGQDVPAIGKEGMERLQSTQDAKDWQDAVKSLLVAEIQDRAGRQLEESRDFLQTVHGSIELFQNNHDLVPGTKDFDVELANEFAKFAAPYEVRVDEKLQGYSIPVQSIIDNLRTQLTSRRAQATNAPSSAAGTQAGSPPAAAGGGSPAAPAQSAPDGPQAAIPSKAGNSGEKEDFSTLFGTIGLPNIQI